VAVVFALPRLYDAVVSRFTAEGPVGVAQSFGWLAPAEQKRTLQRIVWTPGDEAGNLGAVTAPKYTGGNPRQLATVLELCTVEISSYDHTAPANERKQYQAARELYDAWLRAVDLVAHGTYQIVSSKWIGGDRTRRAGAALRVVFTVQAPVVNVPIPTAPLDVGAIIDVHELDVTEILRIRIADDGTIDGFLVVDDLGQYVATDGGELVSYDG
jgi:hypothetical protein